MVKRTIEQQDRIANRLMVHLTCAFLFTLTILYLSNIYNSYGPINGINVLNQYGSIMFYIGIAILIAGIAYVVIGCRKNYNFGERVFTRAIAIGWPAAYSFVMAILGFTVWNFEAIFNFTYLALGLFCLLYIIYYVFSTDFLYAALFAVISVLSMYIIENIPTIVNGTIITWIGSIAWYTFAWKATLAVISAAVGALLLIYILKLRKNKGVNKKTDKRVLPKTALYWPLIGVAIIHILENLTLIFLRDYYKYAMYVMIAFAIVFSITYFARLIYSERK